ncbi:hypothetical protein MKW94_000325, partial [Papaver nudicaule]|nr:hypothetical protein [Papaver nudicaule]
MDQNQCSSSGSGVPDYKNHLNTYAQQSAIPSPVYEYTCTVYLDGEAYRSVNTFGNPEDAEQDASKLALESIAKKVKEECIIIGHAFYHSKSSCLFLIFDSMCCKSILNRYAAKMELPIPTYITTQIELHDFISSLAFDGKTYMGHRARSKQDAERLAAREVIMSILGTSGPGTYLSEIFRSESMLSNASHIVEVPQAVQYTYMATGASPGSNCGGSIRRRKQILNPSPRRPPVSKTYLAPANSKSILHQYAVRMNLPIPTYTTTQLEPTTQVERLRVFISSLVFDGKTYTGSPARRKKLAEQLAAREAINSVG